MNTNRRKGFSIGEQVVIAETSPWNEPGISNRIYEVVDARLRNGAYSYTAAPVGPRGPDRTRALELEHEDLRAVDALRRVA